MSGFASLGRTVSTRSENDVAEASTAILKWLGKEEDALRAYLQIMSGAGVVYAAQCEEKIIRAYVLHRSPSDDHFVDAAQARLCTDAGASISQTQDDLALTQG